MITFLLWNFTNSLGREYPEKHVKELIVLPPSETLGKRIIDKDFNQQKWQSNCK